MKTLILCCLCLLAISTSAQETQPVPVEVPSNYNKITRIENGEIETIKCRIISVSTPHLIVAIDDPNYHAKKIYDTSIQDFVTKSDDYKKLVIEDYPGIDTAAVDQNLQLTVQKVGTIVKSRYGRPMVLELWSCAAAVRSTGESQRRSDEINKQIQQDKAAREAMKARDIADKKQAAAARVLKMNQDAAAKGDMFGLLRMGERYRDGDGVDKDLGKAREYLQKAADAGSPTAKEELSNLKQ